MVTLRAKLNLMQQSVAARYGAVLNGRVADASVQEKSIDALRKICPTQQFADVLINCYISSTKVLS